MRRGGWREHVRAELRAREGRWRGLRRLLERHEQLQERLDAQRPGGGAARPPADPAALPVQLRRKAGESQQQVALQAELLRSAEAESREQRARLGCLARDLAALTRRHQEAECRAWSFARENEELRTELGQARALLQEAQAGRLALEARWLREKALEAMRVNRAIEQEEKYRRKVTRLQEKLSQAKGQAGLPGVDSDGRGGSSLSASSKRFALKRGSYWEPPDRRGSSTRKQLPPCSWNPRVTPVDLGSAGLGSKCWEVLKTRPGEGNFPPCPALWRPLPKCQLSLQKQVELSQPEEFC
ncbi:uncharacterized protein LOC131197379 isoform X2 [Ahaetulla prasina]|uniref:uncharacterized protein LOC131197379 isoform X2 n=1 Tax=Ahaetulla prasina TaxID=499056 RepID=UPI002648753B|nr:uncharacterized protein LOC131197379 isoform X2 [Ahaetulla prasina]